jgi:orotate phosphoribosyltransferase-like protein
MYQQIQGLHTEEKALEISKMWRSIIQKGRNFNEFQTALSDMNMQNQFNKMSVLNVKQFQKTFIN